MFGMIVNTMSDFNFLFEMYGFSSCFSWGHVVSGDVHDDSAANPKLSPFIAELQQHAKAARVQWSLQGLGGHVYSTSWCRGMDPPMLAVGCGDSTLRLWQPTATHSPQRLLWRGITAKVWASVSSLNFNDA